MLPKAKIQHTFHNSGDEDGYKLPVIRSYKTCALSVSLLIGEEQDESSWAEIAFRAEILNDLCVNGENSGGYMQTGRYGRIRIDLMSVNIRNGTVVGGEVDMT